MKQNATIRAFVCPIQLQIIIASLYQPLWFACAADTNGPEKYQNFTYIHRGAHDDVPVSVMMKLLINAPHFLINRRIFVDPRANSNSRMNARNRMLCMECFVAFPTFRLMNCGPEKRCDAQMLSAILLTLRYSSRRPIHPQYSSRKNAWHS